MSQKNSTLNFIIHDANGQPRVVKVVQNNQPLTQVKLKHNPVKIIKLSPDSKGNTQILSPVVNAVNLDQVKGSPNFVQLPVGAIKTLKQAISDSKNLVQEEQKDQELEEAVLHEIIPEVKIKTEPIPLHLDFEIPVTSTSSVENQSAMSYSSRRRNITDNESPPEYTTKRRKHNDKVGKGLRHFSMKVCEKVRTKGFTSYNEVADELVAEFAAGMHGSADSQHIDQKNIRRRVYDALNVLMAMNIISKDKKEIRWIGLPTNSIQECNRLEKEKQARLARIEKKSQQLQELLLQHISFKSLIERNKEIEEKGVRPSPSSAIHLPFIVVNTSDKALIDCSISNDKTEYMFNFNKKFQIHDDIDILKRMGLLFGLDKGECTEGDIEKLKSMVPKSLEYYVEQMARGKTFNAEDGLEEAELEEDDEEGFDVEEEEDEEVEQEGIEPSDDSSDVYV